ncbi:MAG: Mur ligase family protein [Candidatus Altiarchaeota archaeon]|nr:Mur ligase family protein [Candidatus Altiarchaeota archaeon]
MDYVNALRYLDAFKGEGIKPRLEHTKFILDRLGFRQDFKVVHVGGSKGKGSVCAFVNSILCEAGFRVGFYLSPPLQDFTERISVDRMFIPEDDFAALVSEAEPFIEELSSSELGKPTFFEVVTALALRYFQLRGVDFVVLEVGMGGRLDSTNVVDSVVSVVTGIELEHMRYLGTTIRQIAKEKEGIIKPNTTCITSAEDREALETLEKECKERKTKLVRIGADVKYEKTRSDDKIQEFNIDSKLKFRNLKIKLLGEHQIRNAVTAVAAVLEAAEVGEKSIRGGLLKARWPGRLEVVRENPTIILDGAHTLNGMNALKESLKLFKYDKLIVVLGISKDKPMAELTRQIAPLASEVVATKAVVENAGDPNVICEEARKHSKATLIPDIVEAVEHAVKSAGERDLILVTGSLYVVGEARGIWFDKVEL